MAKLRPIGRPRQRPQQDELGFVPYTNSDQLVAPAWKEIWTINERERQTAARLLARTSHRALAGYNDPLSLLQAIDCVSRWAPAFYIRAKYMAMFLNREQSALFWSPVTAGRILSELTELAAEAYQDDPSLTPIISKVDYKGRFWLINSAVTTYKWFWKLRNELTPHIEEMVANEAQGLFANKAESIWNKCNTEAELA